MFDPSDRALSFLFFCPVAVLTTAACIFNNDMRDPFMTCDLLNGDLTPLGRLRLGAGKNFGERCES